MQQVVNTLRLIRRRWVILRALETSIAGVLGGYLIAALLLACELLGWFGGASLWLYLACGPVGYVVMLVIALCRPVSLEETALYADRLARTGEALSSAIEFQNEVDENPFSPLVLGVAVAVAKKIKPKRLIRFELPRLRKWQLGAAALLALALAACWSWVPRLQSAARPGQTKQHTAQIDDNELERLQEMARTLKEAGEEEGNLRKLETARKLDQLINQLEEGKISKREALARLEEVKDEIQRELSAEKGRQESYKELKRHEATKGFAKSISQGKANKTAKAIGASVERMPNARRSAWEKALDRSSRAARGAAEVQDSLRRAEEAVGGRRAKDLKRALEDAGRQLKTSAKSIENGTGGKRISDLQKQLEALEKAGRSIAKKSGGGNGKNDPWDKEQQGHQLDPGPGDQSRDPSLGQGTNRKRGNQAGDGKQGQGQQGQGQQGQGQQGQGQQGQGQQGQGQQGQGQQGQGQQGQGQQGQGQQGQGQQGQGQQGQGQQGSSSQGGQGGGGKHAIYDPEKVEIEFRDVKIKGVRGKGPRTRLGTRWGLPDQKGKPLVEYERVLQRYRKAAEKALSTRGIPRTYKKRVGRYFDDLEQRKPPRSK